MVGLIPSGLARSRSFYPYKIDHALRLNAADSAELTRTPSTQGDRTRWSFSLWAKKSGTTELGLLSVPINSGSRYFAQYDSSERLFNFCEISGAAKLRFSTTAVYRDPSDWHHVLIVADTPNATASERYRLFVNGVRIVDLDNNNYPSQNQQIFVNGTTTHHLGSLGNSNFFDGYFAEVQLLDGIAASPTDFGQFKNGVWVPKRYTGSYGTNGFHLDFSDAANLGKDVSGNGNDFTANNITSDDQVEDTPTRNSLTFSSIYKHPYVTLYESGLEAENPSGNGRRAVTTTHWFNSGKWFLAVKAEFADGDARFEIINNEYDVVSGGDYASNSSNAWGVRFWHSSDIHTLYNGSVISSTGNGSGSSDGDYLLIAFDADDTRAWFGWYDVSADTIYWADASNGYTGDPANGANPSATGIAGAPWTFGASFNAAKRLTILDDVTLKSLAPQGFKVPSALSLPKPEIIQGSKYFNAVTYTGNGGTQSITGVGFNPDLVWVKNRDQSDSHVLVDSVRGTGQVLSSDTSSAESADSDTVTSFDSDGFSLGADVKVNTNGESYVAWCWRKGVAPGFDVVGYTGDGNTSQTISHSLGQVPAVMIVKNRTSTSEWFVYHEAIASDPETDYLRLRTTQPLGDALSLWNDTAPTVNDFTVGSNTSVNANGNNYIAYLWAEAPSFSRFGSYTGNGSADGPFVWCGFRPAFVMIKRTDGTGNWVLHDTVRAPYNVSDNPLYPNVNNAEASTTREVDALSNGFKLRTSDEDSADTNTNGGSYVFLAFAEHPFKYSNAR